MIGSGYERERIKQVINIRRSITRHEEMVVTVEINGQKGGLRGCGEGWLGVEE